MTNFSIFGKYSLVLLLVLALTMCVGMLRLGFWQLGRAAEKQVILNQHLTRSKAPAINLDDVSLNIDKLERFTPVVASGKLLADKSIYIDNQTYQGQVGYQIITPLELTDTKRTVLVNRGWIPIGSSRAILPEFETPSIQLSLSGRLNLANASPPLWDDNYPVSDGKRWQFLPMDQYKQQMKLDVLPLVLELAPREISPLAFQIEWTVIDDKWVAKHKAYAFQWFSMTLAFVIACGILLYKKLLHKYN